MSASSPPLSLADFLLASARRAPDAVALVGDGQRLSYDELTARATCLAKVLRQRGIAPGDRVMLFSRNSIDWVVAFWAIVLAGAVAVPVGATTKSEKLARLVDDCQPAAVFCETRSTAVLAPALAATSCQPATFVFGSPDLLVPHVDDALPSAVTSDALAAIIYTSGSSGSAKGVMLSHGNMVSAAGSIARYLGLVPDDVIQLLSPLSFDYGLYQCLLSARQGCRLVIAPPLTLPGQVLRQAAAEHVTFFPGVPTVFAMLDELGDVSRWELSRVRAVTSTGAPLTLRHLAIIRRTFPAARIFSMYGVTECKRCSYLPPDDIARKPASIGVAIPDTELWLEDERGQRIGPNQVGRIVVRGPHVMQGYWRDPAATAEVLRPGRRPGEGVLDTGDLGRMDDEGYLYFVARTDDVIKSGAEKVAPKEVEMALAGIPGVKEAAVVGIADAVLGQAVKAFVVGDAALTASDLLRACRASLEAHLVPRSIELRSALPRNANGKVDKAALLAGAATESESPCATS